MSKHIMSAVLAEDLKAVLGKMNILQLVEEGQAFCAECGIPVTLENLQFLLPLPDRGAQFVCDSPECVERCLAKVAVVGT